MSVAEVKFWELSKTYKYLMSSLKNRRSFFWILRLIDISPEFTFMELSTKRPTACRGFLISCDSLYSKLIEMFIFG